MKTCTKCGLDKSTDDFYVDNRRNGLRSWCKPCTCVGTKGNRENRLDRDAIVKRDYLRRRMQEPEFRAQRNANWSAWNLNHPELYQGRRLRRKENEGVCSDIDSFVDYSAILYTDVCSYCGATDKITVDHINPVISGGSEEWDNLTAACKSCNSGKRDRSLLHFILKRATDGHGQ